MTAPPRTDSGPCRCWQQLEDQLEYENRCAAYEHDRGHEVRESPAIMIGGTSYLLRLQHTRSALPTAPPCDCPWQSVSSGAKEPDQREILRAVADCIATGVDREWSRQS
jgi:hypothetical protein